MALQSPAARLRQHPEWAMYAAAALQGLTAGLTQNVITTGLKVPPNQLAQEAAHMADCMMLEHLEGKPDV